MNIDIRQETAKDYREVEELTREAFWNLYVPGCDEHYLVNQMRSHDDFLKEYDLVAEVSGKIVGNIMYTKSNVIDENGNQLDTITFGPISVLPAYQNKGIGSRLIKETVKLAISKQATAIIIEGHPRNYCKHGFRSSFDYNISDVDDRFPFSLLVLELQKDVFAGKKWKYHRSPAYDIDAESAALFDKGFPKKAKEHMPSQDEFYIVCRAFIME
jgi:predicted N-acetyltransferase YhbS